MADKIAVMNRGVIEQFATPQEIYDRPVSMFVADFIGSPPMNFLPVHAGLAKGTRALRVNGATVAVPELREDVAPTELALGVRPEHIRFDDASPLRGSVFGAEYLGTTQIVTVTTEHGPIKARLPASTPVQTGRDGRPDLPRRAAFALRQGDRPRHPHGALEGARPAHQRGGTRPSRAEARMADVALASVTKRFGQTAAVDRSTSPIADGEFVVLLGPTGAGKTTTLRLVAGLERPDAGAYPIAGRDVTAAEPAARDVTFVFQQYSLYPHLSVFDNLAFPLRSPARRVPEARDRKARAARWRELLRIAAQAAEPRHAAFRRRDAARRHRPRAGAPAGGLPDGRAALLARRQAARRPPPGAEAHPAGSRRHHPLRHARPDRGDDDGEPHRHPEPRAGWCRSARRARSTRSPRNLYVAARLGQPAINLFPPGLLPDGRAPAGTRRSARAPSISASPSATNGKSQATRRLDRASGRPEPPASQRRRAQAGHAGRPGSGARSRATR